MKRVERAPRICTLSCLLAGLVLPTLVQAQPGAADPVESTSQEGAEPATDGEQLPLGEPALPSPLEPVQDSPAATRPPHAEAAEEDVASQHRWGQHLIVGDHRFLLGAFVPTAIPASYLGVRAGLQYHQVPGFTQLPTLAGTSEQAVVLETLNVAEVIDFSVHLHDLLTIFGDAYGRARVGANISTLLGTGADYTYGGDVGVLVNLLRTGPFVLSARAQIGGYSGQAAGIVGLFQDLNAIAEDAISRVLNNPQTDINTAIAELNNSFRLATAALLTPFSGLTYGGSLNAAVGLGRFVGLQATVGLTVDSAVYTPTRFDVTFGQALATQYQVDSIRPTFGVALDLDLLPIYVPLAFLVEYLATPVDVEASGDIEGTLEGSLEQLLAVGLYYSGRTDLQLGLTAFTVFGQTPTLGANSSLSDNPLDLGAQFVFRYIW